MLARTRAGYANLMKLVSKAYLEGYYYKPRIDREHLTKYSQGLVGLSACLGGEVPRLITEGRLDEARQPARWYKDTFGDFYLEVEASD